MNLESDMGIVSFVLKIHVELESRQPLTASSARTRAFFMLISPFHILVFPGPARPEWTVLGLNDKGKSNQIVLKF